MKEYTELTRVKNTWNGSPRYVMHYLNIAKNYSDALWIAKNEDSCRKFHNKQYGGGIVFSSYNKKDSVINILEMSNTIEIIVKEYLKEVLKEEDYINTMAKLINDIIRVKFYPRHCKYINNLLNSVRRDVIKKDIVEYMQGLTIGIEYMNYTILELINKRSGSNLDIEDFSNCDICQARVKNYWDSFGNILYKKLARKLGY